jgi:TolB protein
VSFSPDGRRLISAARSADRRTEIVELVLATRATRTIASDPAAEFLPSYSPDMSRVYFNSYRSGRSDLYAVQLATGALTRLTTFDGYDAHAQVSPDGTRLAFHREVSKGNYEVVVFDLDSGAERVLAAAPGEDAYPAWSPDGRHLVFSSDRATTPGRLDLFVMGANGDEVRPLTRGGNDSYATWAANGRDVYFVSRREGHGVYRLRLDQARRCRGTDSR